MMPDTPLINKLPNVFLLGAAKAGTTTLYEALKPYSQIYLPYTKEPEFLSQEQLYAKGLEWYCHTFYGNVKAETIRVDATTHYLYWSEKTAPRIASIYPEPPKFILLLRDPVIRAYSWYWNMIQEGLEDQSFSSALAMEEKRLSKNWKHLSEQGLMTYGYVRGSMYAQRFEPFFNLFPRSAFHFIKFDNLIHQSKEVMTALTAFLDIPIKDIASIQGVHNPSTQTQSKALHQWLRKDHQLPEWFKRVVPQQFRYSLKSKLRALNQKKTAYPPLEKEIEREIRWKFVGDLHQLSSMTGLDFSEWLP